MHDHDDGPHGVSVGVQPHKLNTTHENVTYNNTPSPPASQHEHATKHNTQPAPDLAQNEGANPIDTNIQSVQYGVSHEDVCRIEEEIAIFCQNHTTIVDINIMRNDVDITLTDDNMQNDNNTDDDRMCDLNPGDNNISNDDSNQDENPPTKKQVELQYEPDVFPDFKELEAEYRAQYQPGATNIDRIQYLHKHKPTVPAALFKDDGRLSPSGWLWATRAAPHITDVPHFTEDTVSAANQDITDHQARLDVGKMPDPAVVGRHIARGIIDVVVI